MHYRSPLGASIPWMSLVVFPLLLLFMCPVAVYRCCFGVLRVLSSRSNSGTCIRTGEPAVEASSFHPSQLPAALVLPLSWTAFLSAFNAHAHPSCLQVPLLVTAQPQRNRAVLALSAALSAVPTSHAGTCSGHFLLPASVASTLGAPLVFLPSLSSCLTSVPETLCPVPFFLLLPFRSVMSSINLILADCHHLGWNFFKQNSLFLL